MEAKATLEFNLPEQEWDFKYACAGLDALLTLNDIDQELRSALKHECGEFAKLDVETMEAVRAWIWEQRSKRNIPELT